MSNKKDNNITEGKEGTEAYQTLVDWVKSVPDAIAHIKENGNKEDLAKYQNQVKLVIDKMKEIEKELDR